MVQRIQKYDQLKQNVHLYRCDTIHYALSHFSMALYECTASISSPAAATAAIASTKRTRSTHQPPTPAAAARPPPAAVAPSSQPLDRIRTEFETDFDWTSVSGNRLKPIFRRRSFEIDARSMSAAAAGRLRVGRCAGA